MKNPMPSAAERLHDRSITFETLRAAGAHLLWLPRSVDTALNHFPGVTDISALADSAEFHRCCERDNQLFAYPVASWAPPLARLALSHGRLAELYIDRQLRSAARTLKWESNYLQEILLDARSMTQTFWAELAPKFQPGVVVAGKLTTWGYESFLSRWLSPMVTHALARTTQWSWARRSLLDFEWNAIATQTPRDRWAGHLRSALMNALDRLLTDDVMVSVYYSLAYTEEPMRAAAASVGLSYHLLHTRLLDPLCAAILEAASAPLRGHVRIRRELRTALAEVLSMDEFEARYRTDPHVAARKF
jgi:hypothetical protein